MKIFHDNTVQKSQGYNISKNFQQNNTQIDGDSEVLDKILDLMQYSFRQKKISKSRDTQLKRRLSVDQERSPPIINFSVNININIHPQKETGYIKPDIVPNQNFTKGELSFHNKFKSSPKKHDLNTSFDSELCSPSFEPSRKRTTITTLHSIPRLKSFATIKSIPKIKSISRLIDDDKNYRGFNKILKNPEIIKPQVMSFNPLNSKLQRHLPKNFVVKKKVRKP